MAWPLVVRAISIIRLQQSKMNGKKNDKRFVREIRAAQPRVISQSPSRIKSSETLRGFGPRLVNKTNFFHLKTDFATRGFFTYITRSTCI